MSELPDKRYIINKINDSFDSTEYLENIYDSIELFHGKKEAQNYFKEIYKDLFSDLHLKKTYISYNTRKLLEDFSGKLENKD